MTDPVRDLKAVAHSNQSFTLQWKNPEYTNGPVKKYQILWKTDPSQKWTVEGVGQKQQYYSFNWAGTALHIGYAPVVYWKVEIHGFVNQGPTSEVHAFRVSPGGIFCVCLK